MWWKCQLPLSLLGLMTITMFLSSRMCSTFGKIYLDDKTKGYTGVVVAMTDNAVNNATNALKLINNVKVLMTNASQMLYETTGNRLYFKHITILLPYSWREFDNIEFDDWSTNELFHFASVHVGSMNPDHGDIPYTLQREDCSEPGDYIHLTPDYIFTMSDNDFMIKYDNAVKEFVSEWVRFRFGVFTENHLDEFYYDANEAGFRPTYCSDVAANGKLINPITKTHCLIDELGMPLEYCQFEIDPKGNDNLTSSLLFTTKLPNVAEFCNETTHNKYAPTLHNRRCEGKSAWKIMMQHSDFSSNASVEINSTEPEFRIITARQFPSVTLAIDTASKSNKTIADSIVASISLYLIFAVPCNTTVKVAAVEDEIIREIAEIKVQTMTDRKHLITAVENILLTPTNAHISGNAIQEKLEDHIDWYSGAVIYITTSAEKKGNWSMLKGARFLPIFLNVIPNKELTEMADNTDGNSYAFFGNPLNLEEDLEAALFDSSHYWDGDQIIQISSTTVEKSQEMPVNFLVDKAVLGQVRIVVSATTENGIYDEELLLVSPDRFYKANHTASMPECERQIQNFSIEDGKAGLWSLRLTNHSAELQNRLVIKVFAVIPQCTPAITSSVRINPKVVQVHKNNIQVPRLTITLQEDGGFYNPTSVTVTVFSPHAENVGGNITKYPLDDGSGSDVIRHDGVFSTFINYIVTDGVYKIVPRVYGGNIMDCIIGYATDCFQRHPCPLYFQVTGSENGSDILPDRITNLVGKVKLNTYDDTVVTLLWTAPGDSTYDGIVRGYDLQLFETYENALSFTQGMNVTERMIIGGSLVPVSPGENQTVTVWFSSVAYGYIATGYIAIRAYDKDGNRASASNIVIIPLTPTDNPSNATTEFLYTTTSNSTDDDNTTTPAPVHSHAYDGVISSFVLLAFAILVAGGFLIEMQITKCKEKRSKHEDYTIGHLVGATPSAA